jgi:uncharacterized protein YndB with AHSA1/START domain
MAYGRMVIRVTETVEIGRAPQDVFAYLTDPAKLATWQNLEEIEQLTPGPVGAGTRFREVHRVLGTSRPEITEVVVLEPGRRFDIRVVQGPPVDGRWDFEPAGAGTRLTFTPTVRLPAPLRPLVELLTALLFARFHRRLKRALEARP